ncbi:hypothetical protein ZTR_11089, partial [Talaromyces verruculosus]
MQWYMPRDVQSNACDPTIVKFNKDNGASTVNGIIIQDNFDNDHIFEVQLISLFLEWLCNTNAQTTYSSIGVLGFIPGWQRADATWCAYVFGSDTETGGFDFPLNAQDTSPANFLSNTASVVGGSLNLNLM